MLGNPPWERIKIQEKEWFASRRADIANAANAAQRRRMIVTLVDEDPELYTAFMDNQRKAMGESHLVRDSGHYPLCGRGDVNTYAIFAEDMRLILSQTGRMGCIVPSGVATDDITKFFFQNLMENLSLISLYDFENRDGIFPGVHRSYKFSLLTLTGSSRPAIKGAEFVFFAHQVGDLQDNQRRFTLSASDIKLLNPNTRTCPIFRSQRDMLITKAIYTRVPVLIKEGSVEEKPWNVSFCSMFHMSNDSHLFNTRQQLEMTGWQLVGNVFHRENEQYLPFYEGKMTWHFDHRFSTYDNLLEEFGDLNLAQHQNPCELSLPHYWVHESHLPICTNLSKDEAKRSSICDDIRKRIQISFPEGARS